MSGENHYLLFHALPVRGDEGFTGLVGTAVNVTALKDSERERANLQLALADSQKLEAIGTLASGVAHDFNNLLAGVRGFLELASLEVDGTSQAAEFLRQAQAGIDQARDVTAGLLTFARRESGDQKVFAFNELIAENVDFLRKLVPASISVETDLGASEIRVCADPSQLRQVLVNLIINARDAMPDGGDLRINLSRKDDNALLLVSDTGRGMDQAVQKRMFEPFFTTKPHGQGTGLGLSVVHGIAKAHDGRVDVDSSPDTGTRVSVLVPLTEDTVSEVLDELPANIAGAGQRVLIVEDNQLVRESCVLRVQSGGFSACGAANGVEALAALTTADRDGLSIDAVLLDVDLPGSNGVAVAREIRHKHADMPIIYITGNVQNPALQQISSEPVLAKPLDFAVLFATLNELLAGSNH